jgi:hypothetical protein
MGSPFGGALRMNPLLAQRTTKAIRGQEMRGRWHMLAWDNQTLD